MLFIALLVFNVVQSAADVSDQKLIRVNEWQDITIDGSTNEDALLDFHLFATCEKFSVLFMTEESEATRFSFSYYDVVLKKIDVESEEEQVQIPQLPKMMGTCRETHRKVLRMKLISSNDTIAFKVDDQLIRRPFESNRLRVLIPQNVACCLIRALFLGTSDARSYTPIKYQIRTRSTTNRVETTTSLFRSTTQIVESDTTRGVDYSRIYTLGKEGRDMPAQTTSKPRPESSWTHAVNKQWSTTFVLCSLVVLSIMLFLAVFGTFTVFYLMKKPKDGKSPFAIDA